MTQPTGIALFLPFDEVATLRGELAIVRELLGGDLPSSVTDLLDAITEADPRTEDPDAAIRRRGIPAASRVVAEGLRSQLARTGDELERGLILEDLVRIVYEFVKFDSPEGGGLDGRDGPERAAIGAVLAAATDHVASTRRRPSSSADADRQPRG